MKCSSIAWFPLRTIVVFTLELVVVRCVRRVLATYFATLGTGLKLLKYLGGVLHMLKKYISLLADLIIKRGEKKIMAKAAAILHKSDLHEAYFASLISHEDLKRICDAKGGPDNESFN